LQRAPSGNCHFPSGGARTKFIGFTLQRRVIIDLHSLGMNRGLDAALGLLHDMGKFMPKQLLARLAVGIVLSWSEVNIGALRIRMGSERLGLRALVNAYG
jgi:hypothetical protein